ncbi:RING-H2 finger protein ATL5-like [Cucumis melo]|nr:RING-H2 finger protein ATL5-like [Cucumis melo]
MQLLAQTQAEIIRQRQTTTQSNDTTEGEETSSAVMTVAYKVKDNEAGGSYCCCAICIEEFEDEEICGVVESCGHCFHEDCMDQWLRIESRCPLCRCLVHAVSQQY